MKEGLITVLHLSVMSSYLEDAQQAITGSVLYEFLRGHIVYFLIYFPPELAPKTSVLASENLNSAASF